VVFFQFSPNEFSSTLLRYQYYIDLKRDDFTSDEDYLEERVKRGMQAGYTFQQCFEHWLDDFKQALDIASEQQQQSPPDDNASNNASEQQQQPNDK